MEPETTSRKLTLARAGVAVSHLRNPTMIHGFFWMKGVIGHTSAVYEQVGRELKKAFGTT